jgi:hypothetical protein
VTAKNLIPIHPKLAGVVDVVVDDVANDRIPIAVQKIARKQIEPIRIGPVRNGQNPNVVSEVVPVGVKRLAPKLGTIPIWNPTTIPSRPTCSSTMARLMSPLRTETPSDRKKIQMMANPERAVDVRVAVVVDAADADAKSVMLPK